MSCTRPLKAWRAPGEASASGARPVTFSRREGYTDIEVDIPCGRCQGCRLDRARQWAIRCVHEAALHDANVFVTLTYRPEDEPPGRTLVKRDVSYFMRKLRAWWRRQQKHLPKEQRTKVRFFFAGEYGDDSWRPHYHGILFGVDFADRTPWKKTPNGDQLWISPTLEKLWGHGFTSIGMVTYQSAGYVARYCMKKVTGQQASTHYERLCPQTGEVFQLLPEFALMSLKPGIGAQWFERFQSDLYPSDFVVMDGGPKGKPPRYYERLKKRIDASGLRQVKEARERRARDPKIRYEGTERRLAVREEVTKAKLSLKKRNAT